MIRKLDVSLILGVFLAVIAFVLGGLLLMRGRFLEGFSVMFTIASAVWLTSGVLDRIEAVHDKLDAMGAH